MNKKTLDRPAFASFFRSAYSGFFQVKKDVRVQSKTGDAYSVSYKKYKFLWFIWIVLRTVSDLCCIVGAGAAAVYVRDTVGSASAGAYIGIVSGVVLVEFLIAFVYFAVCYFNIRFERIQEPVTAEKDTCKSAATERGRAS